ncbi:MAG: DNA repair exonuclease [Planctomycetota bacterium]|nr:DNA repair exonuclease [Planctomycetota bacterium]
MNPTLKFIHASDLHLERSFSGVGDLPDSIRTVLVDAAYTAAERIFDQAIGERVDFVLLSGDVADIDHCGPRGISFLLEQFERLKENGIHVYWAGGEHDQLERWPTMISALENVHLFSSPLVEKVVHRREGKVIASIFGTGYAPGSRRIEEFHAEEAKGFAVGLCYGELATDEISKTGIQYWALGGVHVRSDLADEDSRLVFSGTSQSRGPHEAGSHGSTLVCVDKSGFANAVSLATDSVRWIQQNVVLVAGMSKSEMQTKFENLAFEISAELNGQLALVSWQVSFEGGANEGLDYRDWFMEINHWLRGQFGPVDGTLWSMGIQCQVPGSLAEHGLKEDTILGDFLRTVQAREKDTETRLDLSPYAGCEHVDEAMVAAIEFDDDQAKAILQDSAMMGIKLLSGAEEKSV